MEDSDSVVDESVPPGEDDAARFVAAGCPPETAQRLSAALARCSQGQASSAREPIDPRKPASLRLAPPASKLPSSDSPAPSPVRAIEPGLTRGEAAILQAISAGLAGGEELSFGELEALTGLSRSGVRKAVLGCREKRRLDYVPGDGRTASRWKLRSTLGAPEVAPPPLPAIVDKSFFDRYVSPGTLHAATRARGALALMLCIYASLQNTKRRSLRGGMPPDRADRQAVALILRDVGIPIRTACWHAARQTSDWVVHKILTTLAKETNGQLARRDWKTYFAAALRRQAADPTRESFRAALRDRDQRSRLRLIRGDAG